MWSRWLQANRPAVLLTILIAGSLISMGAGIEATIVGYGVRRAVALIAYPFLVVRTAVMDIGSYSFDFAFQYDALLEESAQRQLEIARLRNAVVDRGELRLQNDRLREQLGFVRQRPEFVLEPAEVMRSFRGMLEIDRGRISGMRAGLPVIAEDGVVGIVTEVTDFTSFIATLHHVDCRVGAMLQRNRLRAYDGVVHASSQLDVICTIQYIDSKHDVRPGDVVVTSPESMFPSGYPIGTIERIHEHGSLWKMADIAPFVDPYALDEVYIVLESLAPVEDFTGLVSQEPDPGIYLTAAANELPIQEQYAP